jgi:hypothetical protein
MFRNEASVSHYADRNWLFLISLYLLALFLIGLGYLSILPAFEGLDEIGHYSSVRQIAETGTIPIYGSGFVDEAIQHYEGPGPDIPGFHFPTYRAFFALPKSIDNYISSYRNGSFPVFRPGQESNNETQHPPLFYVVLAPIEKAIEHLPLLTQLFSLRLVSFLIALLGVGFGLLAVRTEGNPAIVGFVLYPIVFPMFFSEFARMGNDNLCLLFVGLMIFLLSKWLKDENNKRLAASIGVVLGLGLLTKAFFLPIIAALGTCLLVRAFSDSNTRVSERLKGLVPLFLPAFLIGGGWYVYQLVVFGTPTGNGTAIYLDMKGGLIAGLKQKFTMYALFRGLVAFFKSYLWAGSQSLAKLPAILFIPTMVLVALSFGAFLLRLKNLPFKDIAWLPVIVLAFFGAGFFYQMLLTIAVLGQADTPGWYLHILMPWLAPILGIGISSLLAIRRLRPIIIGLLLYAFVFQVLAVWAQLALFAGCAIKTDDSFYAFAGNYICLDQFSSVLGRVQVLGWSALAVIGYGGGLFCIVLLIWILRARFGTAGQFNRRFGSERDAAIPC